MRAQVFAKAYVQRFKFQTLVSADFRDFFEEWCAAQAPPVDCSSVDWAAWLVTPGLQHLPQPVFDNEHGARCVSLAEAWIGAPAEAAPDGAGAADVAEWKTAHWIAFLEHLLATLGSSSSSSSCPRSSFGLGKLRQLDALYALTPSKNSEVCFVQRLCRRRRPPPPPPPAPRSHHPP